MSPRTLVLASGTAEPLDPTSWSGIPMGLAAGLEAHGMTVSGVSSSLGHTWDELLRVGIGMRYGNRRNADRSSEMDGIRSRVIAARLRHATPDGVIQLGTGFRVSGHRPVVTLEDATVLQSLGTPTSGARRLRPSVRAAWVERQRTIYGQVQACCCASAWTARSIIEDYGVPAQKVHVVGFGRNLEVPPTSRRWDVPSFLWIGRDWERKNGPQVLSAFEAVRRSHPQARIDFVGGHPPLEGRAGVMGHGELRFDDERDQLLMRSLLQRATVFVMPSLYEPFGIVYVEAGAAGVPSIGTTHGGAADAVGAGGVLVDPDDQRALVEAMLALTDPAKAQELGQRAVRHAARFTWPAVAERVLAALFGADVAQS